MAEYNFSEAKEKAKQIGRNVGKLLAKKFEHPSKQSLPEPVLQEPNQPDGPEKLADDQGEEPQK